MPKPDLVAEVRERHYEVVGCYRAGKPIMACNCVGPWPCDAIRLADEVERLRKEISGMRWTWEEVRRLRAENEPMQEALIRLRDCDWTIGRGDRMDRVREIARAAIPTETETGPKRAPRIGSQDRGVTE